MNKIVMTNDQSPTLYSERFDQTYHSIHGAISESSHVFIQYGLEPIAKQKKAISVFEMGLGTALNASLTWDFALKNDCDIDYTAIELYPVDMEQVLYFQTQFSEIDEKLNIIHEMKWNQEHVFPHFVFQKIHADMLSYPMPKSADIIYYDAFSPNTQPELWTEELFQRMFQKLSENGVLVTYCAKGEVKRILKRCGFVVSSPPGPVGKREMTVALKQRS